MRLLLFIHLLVFRLSSRRSFDPRIEEFVWFESSNKEIPQNYQGEDCCNKLEKYRKSLWKENYQGKKNINWIQNDQLFANYFFSNRNL